MNALSRRWLYKRCKAAFCNAIDDRLAHRMRDPLKMPVVERLAYDAGYEVADSRFREGCNVSGLASVFELPPETWALVLAEAQRP